MMHEVSSPIAAHEYLATERCRGRRIGFVPTMGYLHRGHLSLVEAARSENDTVVMSIFVNPTQFGPGEDFERYPRNLERDRALASDCGVDLLFVPGVEDLYPGGRQAQRVWVEPGPLAKHLEGQSRPHHFRGVATVVAKLLNVLTPHRAYFGQKDAQQARVVQQVACDLSMPTEIKVCPIVREPDGLALSSRNVYLSPAERVQAVALPRALERARQIIAAGERDAQVVEEDMRRTVQTVAPASHLDYATVADWETMEPVTGTISGDAVLALAARFGETRLIDNEVVRLVDGAPRFGW